MSGDELRKLRAAMKMSQQALSKVIDVSVRGIRRWETCEVKIPKIAEFAMHYLVGQKRQSGNR